MVTYANYLFWSTTNVNAESERMSESGRVKELYFRKELKNFVFAKK